LLSVEQGNPQTLQGAGDRVEEACQSRRWANMYISHWAIDRPRVVLVGVALVIVLAVLAAMLIPVQRVPAITTAVVLVTVPYPGAQPTEVEDEVTRRIEDSLARLKDVDKMLSLSLRGSSVVNIIFEDGVPAEQAEADVKQLVDEVRAQLPAGREVEPIITSIDFESSPLMLVSLSGPPGFDERALRQIAEDVMEELDAIPGVANSQLFGGREREIHVDLNPDLLAAYDLTLEDVVRAIRGFHSARPGGALDTGLFEPHVRSETKFRSVDDVRQVVVAERQGRLIRLDDLGQVHDTFRRLRNTAELDGQQTATIVVNKEANINTLGTARAVKRRVRELAEQYPHIHFATSRDISYDIGVMFSVLGSSAVFGAMLVLVILTWTMGLRISVLVVTAIPFSTAVGLIFLFASGIAISILVIFSFILVLGMVVDGSIIVAENIHRHLERGEDPVTAAKTGIDEVGIPVISADLTTICAFLPMLLVPGIMGDFMGVMPKVVSVALAGSIIVDHLLIPVVAAYWYRRQESRPAERPRPAAAASAAVGSLARNPASRIRPHHGPFTRAYAFLLRWALCHRWVVVVCCLLAIVWAGSTLPLIGFAFFPRSDRGQFEISYELPLGYSIYETLRASRAITDPLRELQERGEVVHFVNAVGSSAGLAARLDTDPATGPEFGKIMVELTPPTERSRHQDEIIAELRSKIRPWPGMKYRIDEIKEGPSGGADVAVRLTGKDLEQLARVGQMLADRLAALSGTREVSSDYRPDNPELVIEPKPEIAGLFGMTEAQVAAAIQTAILGDSSLQLTLDDEYVTLRVQAAPEFQDSKEDLTRLMLTSPTGRKATVGELADVRRSTGLYAVNRYDRRRAVTVRCDVKSEQGVLPDDIFGQLRRKIMPELGFQPVVEAPGALARLLDSLRELPVLGKMVPPRTGGAMEFVGTPGTPSEGLRASFTGENEERDKNMRYLFRVMIVGVMLIFAILVIQFNSFRQAVLVLLTVPLSFVGVVFGMLVCGDPFSLASFIGLVALAGIVVNDAIVLVDFANQARRRGMRVRHALIEAGINRLRPVMLTTVTTIGGLLPLFLNLSGGAEFWRPLTGAIIFGLGFATVLTLIVIPAGYSLAYSWAERRAGHARSGKMHYRSEVPPARGR